MLLLLSLICIGAAFVMLVMFAGAEKSIATISRDSVERMVELKGREIAQAGYSKDKPHVLTLNEKCFIQGKRDRVLFHDCDATFGDSGSPILVRDGDKIGVGAVNVAVRSSKKDPNKSIGIAITLPEGALKK